jgi:muramoyltetrapeptide carboxypeptidase
MGKGKALKNGFGVIVTSSPLSKERTELASQNILGLGYSSAYSLAPYKYYANYDFGFANGSVGERIDSIEKALVDSNSDCILASRGGSGALDLLPHLPLDKISKFKKIFIGQSDFTLILLQVAFRCNVPAIFGPTFGADFADYHELKEAKESVDTLLRMLTDESFRLEIRGEVVEKKGTGQGQLIGGNLSMLLALLGTPYDVSYEGKILVLEEVGESPYKIERMLTQLLLSEKLTKVRGICFGRFARCESKVGPSVEDVILRVSERLKQINVCPILKNLPFGHWGMSNPLPLGVKAEISGDTLVTLESPISK